MELSTLDTIGLSPQINPDFGDLGTIPLPAQENDSTNKIGGLEPFFECFYSLLCDLSSVLL